VSDRPILYSAPMVRALLDGRKTQTRRVLKLPTKTASGGRIYERKDMGGWEPTINGGAGCFTIAKDGTRVAAPETVGIWHRTTGVCMDAPYQVGDRLWVRETWTARMTHGWTIADARSGMYQQEILYRADGHHSIDGWWPSIFLPREFSRLTQTVTEVRVQRVQDISEADAVAEGCFKGRATGRVFENVTAMRLGGDEWATARDWYADLWDRLNARRGFGWDANPWVVAVTATTHLQNIDAIGAEAA